MPDATLREQIAAMDTKLDTVLTDVADLKSTVRQIELGIAKRSGTWAVLAKFAMFAGGIGATVLGAVILSMIKN